MSKYLIRNKAPVIMNYQLNNQNSTSAPKTSRFWSSLWPIIRPEKISLIWASLAIIINSLCNLAAPIIIGQAVDKFLPAKNFSGIIWYSEILIIIFVAAFIASYLQTIIMGQIGQRVLFNLRNMIFTRLNRLPIAFFNANQAGDLISRINNDTDKLNQFFSQTLMQFIGNAFVMIGAGILLVVLDIKLGLIALLPALILVIFTQIISPLVKKRNAQSLQSVGSLSAEIQESLDNFKVIIAYDRRAYFRDKFWEVNQQNYAAAVSAGILSNIFNPVYGLSANLGQLAVLAAGLYFISQGDFTIGWLISFLSYAYIFYTPLRQIAALWANLQLALASWDRIAQILILKNNLHRLRDKTAKCRQTNSILHFSHVDFGYTPSEKILKNVSFNLEKGKTYAFVGPTGGGKTTTASLMARLYDPNNGVICFDGQDIRSYTRKKLTAQIGFILQEPILLNTTVGENICYGNPALQNLTNDALFAHLRKNGLHHLLSHFSDGLDTRINAGGDTASLGQKQLLAFVRAVLREPKLLILDEATANIDTITEQELQKILDHLPATTTRVIIAHRLNTIANADVIFFVNNGEIVEAGSMQAAVDMLLHEKRKS